MLHEKGKRPADWMRAAEKDWRRLGQVLESGDADEAGIWLHQATEKYLKAYLLSNGWVYRRIHDLEVLLSEATEYRRDLYRYCPACRKISGYHVAYRYPLTEGPSLTVADVLNSREDIEPAIDDIRQELS
jgi:HEPN domain-containing protein